MMKQPNFIPGRSQQGFSLVELMVALTIGLIILAGMVTVFVSATQSRNELEKTSRQIENGRYAIEMLREDVQLAGFYGEYFPAATVTWTTPDPCSTVLQDMGFAPPNYSWNTTAQTQVPVGVYGYTGAATAPSCVSNRLSGTDILVVRRASTSSVVTTAAADGEYYLQVSKCSDSPVESVFVLGKTPASFTLHSVEPAGTPLSCKNGALSKVRKYIVHIYYISSCNDCSGSGDGIPTLKMVELTAGSSGCAANPATSCGSMTTRAVAEGIEDLQLEYGIDSSGTGGVPDTFTATPAAADWPNAMAVKVFLRARNTEATKGYVDSKTYTVDSAGTQVGPFGDPYMRHAYTVTIRAMNIAGRREI